MEYRSEIDEILRDLVLRVYNNCAHAVHQILWRIDTLIITQRIRLHADQRMWINRRIEKRVQITRFDRANWRRHQVSQKTKKSVTQISDSQKTFSCKYNELFTNLFKYFNRIYF